MLRRMLLYRPTGLVELRLVAERSFRRWPPRLPEQPIFYPVLTVDYARAIAREWNTVDAASGYVGFVTRFELDDAFAARYPVQVAGGRAHEELWIPAEEVDAMNDHLIGTIEVIEAYAGAEYRGTLDPHTHLPSAW
jgi:hypothetical protein